MAETFGVGVKSVEIPGKMQLRTGAALCLGPGGGVVSGWSSVFSFQCSVFSFQCSVVSGQFSVHAKFPLGRARLLPSRGWQPSGVVVVFGWNCFTTEGHGIHGKTTGQRASR
ncbi:MAG: hypothetical protein RIT02_827 [Planctomycetota bacterium]